MNVNERMLQDLQSIFTDSKHTAEKLQQAVSTAGIAPAESQKLLGEVVMLLNALNLPFQTPEILAIRAGLSAMLTHGPHAIAKLARVLLDLTSRSRLEILSGSAQARTEPMRSVMVTKH